MDPERNIPSDFICSISTEIMQDPVIDNEGMSYERSCIMQWLANHSTSPLTNMPLRAEDLRPNIALRNAIEEFLHGSNTVDVTQACVQSVPVKHVDELKKNVFNLDVNLVAGKDHALLSLLPPEGFGKVPVHICCVVDVSGSMGTEAKISNDKGSKESHGFSVLDVVKHALKTIIACLSPADGFSLITFSGEATTICSLQSMTSSFKDIARNKVNTLQPTNQTNLWAGLVMGMDLLKNNASSAQMNSLFLLTDGRPNISPGVGEVAALKRYKSKCPDNRLPASINFFGFGYEMDGELLSNLALCGGGLYSFIPDTSFVGTAFVNALSNVFTTAARDITVIVNVDSKTQILTDKGCYENYTHSISEDTLELKLGSLFYGQDMHIVLPVSLHSKSSFKINLTGYNALTNETSYLDLSYLVGEDIDSSDKEVIDVNVLRLEFVTCINRIMSEIPASNFSGFNIKKDDLKSWAKLVNDCESQIQKSKFSKNEYIKDLLKDLRGQVREAISKEQYFEKWGRHYLPSLMMAHLFEICNNFKDPGVQHFGGNLFRNIREELDEIFIKIPAPKPSIVQNAPVRPLSTMHRYHRSSAPCFTGDCFVETPKGLLPIYSLLKGTQILTSDGSFSSVLCVLKTDTSDLESIPLIRFRSGLTITPWHPIIANGIWSFPYDCRDGLLMNKNMDVVYSILLSNRKPIVVNGVSCASLAHNEKGAVIGHTYFGTDKVVNDLKLFPGFASGMITIKSSDVLRCNKTGNVFKILPSKANFVKEF